MHSVLPLRRLAEAAPYMDQRVLRHLEEGETETFESFEDFSLIAFDWYDVRGGRTEDSQILLYLDKENLFAFYEDDTAGTKVQTLLDPPAESLEDNQLLLYRFFVRLLTGDMDHLDRLETDVSETENAILSGGEGCLDRIIAWRRELLRLKRYYEQLDAIFDGLAANDNGLLSKAGVRRMVILSSRTDRYLSGVQNLREAVAQLREAYQSQLSIQQNELMKLFTVATVIFLPLTLIAGWYGMNFTGMPELAWRYGYPAVILVSAGVVAGLIWYFKRKKWL